MAKLNRASVTLNLRRIPTSSGAVSQLKDIFPKPAVEPDELSPDVLAFIGDAVFNLYAKLLVLSDTKVGKLHTRASNVLSRGNQRRLLSLLFGRLDEHERSIVQRGLNSKGARKHGKDEDYIQSTGFEALVGYLYLSNRERLAELLEYAFGETTEGEVG